MNLKKDITGGMLIGWGWDSLPIFPGQTKVIELSIVPVFGCLGNPMKSCGNVICGVCEVKC